MEHDFSIEEILDMPTEGEVQMNLPLANIDCVGQDDLCKTSDYKEPDYIEADSESQGEKIRRELFCVTGNDIEELY